MTAVAHGMGQSEAARTFGVGARSVRRWVAQIRPPTDRRRSPSNAAAAEPARPGRSPPAGPSASSVSSSGGRCPDQLELPFYLWTREAVRRLIAKEYGVRLGLSAVGSYLKAWGLSPQRPVRRAYERDPQAIAQWLKQEYPKIKRAAKRERAVIYWGDESGLRSSDVRGAVARRTRPHPGGGRHRPAFRLQPDLGAEQSRDHWRSRVFRGGS
ncbi:MAG: winged helix-turn-helix domain-containing protein [Chromatiales bacterium]|nr:winged helix-turn-helix domain-containing protein [Chromatiales bacterium]